MLAEERDLLVTIATYLIENYPGSRMAQDLKLKLEALQEADNEQSNLNDYLHMIDLEAQFGQD